MAEEKRPIETEKGSMTEVEAQKMVEGGRWYSPKQIADKLGYTTAWICALLEQKRIKGHKPLGGRWRVPPEEYEKLLKEGIPPLPREVPRPPPRRILVPKETADKIAPPTPPIPPSPTKPEGRKFPWSLFEI